MLASIKDEVNAFRIYRVHPDTPITIQVLIGDGQAGGVSLEWEDTQVNFPGEDREPKVIGEGTGVVHTFLYSTIKVRDINPQTNRTSVVLRLAGGPEPKEYAFEFEVAQALGSVYYNIKFFFIP